MSTSNKTIVIEEVPAQYREIAKKFPAGVAQILPIYEAYDWLQFIEKPTKEQKDDPNSYRRPRTRTILLTMQRAHGTHSVSGLPNVKEKEYDIEIFPQEPFTNKLKGVSTDFKGNPFAIIDALLNHDGYGHTFKLVAPPVEHLEKLERNAKKPEVQKELRRRQSEMSSLAGRQKALDAENPYGADKNSKRKNYPSIGKPGKVEEYGEDEGLEEMEVVAEPTAEELDIVE